MRKPLNVLNTKENYTVIEVKNLYKTLIAIIMIICFTFCSILVLPILLAFHYDAFGWRCFSKFWDSLKVLYTKEFVEDIKRCID